MPETETHPLEAPVPQSPSVEIVPDEAVPENPAAPQPEDGNIDEQGVS